MTGKLTDAQVAEIRKRRVGELDLDALIESLLADRDLLVAENERRVHQLAAAAEMNAALKDRVTHLLKAEQALKQIAALHQRTNRISVATGLQVDACAVCGVEGGRYPCETVLLTQPSEATTEPSRQESAK